MEPNPHLLLGLIKQRDEKTFRHLFVLLYPELVIYAQNYLFDRAMSEDVVQEVFIFVWENAETLEIAVSFKSYIYRMVRNRCLNHLRTLKLTDPTKAIETLFHIEQPGTSPLDEGDQEKIRKINQIVSTFPAGMQKIFKMRYYQGHTYNEIAAELAVTVNTVKTQLTRARKRIIDQLSR